jgi:hypothetical protein
MFILQIFGEVIRQQQAVIQQVKIFPVIYGKRHFVTVLALLYPDL